MTCDEIFLAYRMFSPDVADYGHFPASWHFCDDIFKEGMKTAAVSQDYYEETGEEVPMPGDVLAVTDQDGSPRCLVKVDSLMIVHEDDLDSITPRYGEGRLFSLLSFHEVFR